MTTDKESVQLDVSLVTGHVLCFESVLEISPQCLSNTHRPYKLSTPLVPYPVVKKVFSSMSP